MVGSMYKVVRDYDPPKSNRDEYLPAEKGDILVDCETVDEHWFRGRNMMSEVFGKIPKSYTEAFTSNDEEDNIHSPYEEDNIHSPYEDIDADFNSKESTALLENTSGLTTNPLLDAVDERESSETEIKGNLSKFPESNYVDMSSGETINEEQPCLKKSKSMTVPEENVEEKRIPPKPCRSFHGSAKASDDGYNSGSHYSGENSESAVPTTVKAKISKQDAAGYEVPHTVFDVVDGPDDEASSKLVKSEKGKKTFLRKFGFKRDETKQKRKFSQTDDSKEKYYDPPSDYRDNYFLPETEYSTIRMMLSFIVALGIALGLFLVLYIIAKVAAVLCFALAVPVFVTLLLLPSTITRRGLLCVFVLCMPCLVSSRAKVALLLLLTVLFVCGPMLGIADKLTFGIDCEQELTKAHVILRNGPIPSHNHRSASKRVRKDTTGYPVHQACQRSLGRVNDFCVRVYDNFHHNYCKQKDQSDDIEICSMKEYAFCWNQTTIDEVCTITASGSVGATARTSVKYVPSAAYDPFTILNIHVRQVRNTESARNILLYLLPLLFLLVLTEAYSYNRLYLCTKNMDNIYITHRLRELDCERKNRGLTDVIFPLTRIEFHTYLMRNSFSLSKTEKKSLFKWIIVFIIVLMCTVGLVALENKVRELLVETMTSSCERLLNDEKENEYRVFIFLLNFIILFIIFIQSHMLRCRTVICDYFYADMIDIRSKHLYYKILHDRHTFARHVRRKVQLLSEEKRLTRRISFKSKVYEKLPQQLQQICSKLTMRRCMICNSISYHQTIECKEVYCMAHYCFECYVDAGQQCLTCNSTNDRTVSIAI